MHASKRKQMVEFKIMEIGVDSFNEPTDGVRLVQANVKVYRNGEASDSGTLYITEEEVLWWDDVHQTGLRIQYQQLGLHAISRDTTHFPFPCIYCQVEGVPSIRIGGGAEEPHVRDSEDDAEEDDGAEDDEMEADSTLELRIVPDDILALDTIYAALCTCQELHPDEDDEDAGEMFSAFEQVEAGAGDEEAEDEDLEEMRFPVQLTDVHGNPIEDEEEEEGAYADAD